MLGFSAPLTGTLPGCVRYSGAKLVVGSSAGGSHWFTQSWIIFGLSVTEVSSTKGPGSVGLHSSFVFVVMGPKCFVYRILFLCLSYGCESKMWEADFSV